MPTHPASPVKSRVASVVVLVISDTLDRCDRTCLNYHRGTEWIQVVNPTKA